MNKWLSVICLAMLLPAIARGQHDVCSHAKIQNTAQFKTTVASPDENRYDIKHVKLDISLDNNSVAVSGNATTTALVLEDNFALYVCELNNLLTIDSILINNISATFTHKDGIVNVFMPQLLQSGAVFIAKVFYHGLPPAGSVFTFQSGMNNAMAEAWKAKVTYSLSQPYMAKDWWPCKQSLTDKIDYADIWITVPDTLMAGSNGVLMNTTVLPDSKKRYEWKTSYPTDYYLLSVSVANYTEYTFSHTIPSGENILVQNFIYNRPGILDTFKKRIDTTAEMLNLFSDYFGAYPFYKEKYGHCMSPVFGGMEHQTMTTLQHFNAPLVAHELAHQWFGDNVTCASWRDIWLNEGFASYGEYLFFEKYHGKEAANKYMLKNHERILTDTNNTGSVYLPAADTVNPYRIFDARLSYLKPAAVLHTLRYIVGDGNFFKILKEYQQQYADGNARTSDFVLLAQQVSGMQLDTFFKEWIYGEGYPVYDIKWNQTANTLLLQIEQEGCVPQSVSFFNTPVAIKLFYASGDTVIRIKNGQPQTHKIKTVDKITGIVFDPDNVLLNKETITHDYTLGMLKPNEEIAFAYPNPAKEEWIVINLKPGYEMTMTDAAGKTVWSAMVNAANGVAIPAALFASGVYVLHISDNKKEVISRKLIRL